jgi:hypothetical protein
MNFPYVSVRVARSATTRLGSSNPRQRIRMDFLPNSDQ